MPLNSVQDFGNSIVQRLTSNGLTYYQFEQWQTTPALIHGVFTRLGGVSAAPWASLNLGASVGDDLQAVACNAERFYSALGLDRSRACTVWQVHGAETVIATEARADHRWLAQADAILTERPGLPLSMRFADCVPVLLYDPVHPAIGLVHAGWRGTMADVVGSALRAMTETFGTRPTDVQAAIGPSIGPECYQVGPEVIEATRTAFGDVDGLIYIADDGSAHLDLWATNRRALERAGVGKIEISGLCTACHTDEFFSHRAEHGRTGRFGAVMALAER
ncbi:MAG: peptidoglycan editing factor PgeF [Aggregatilineales bacterium]